jgi:hypothetical protein
VCLPVLARLWRPRHTGKIAHARQLAELLAARYPDRTVHVVGDAAYVGERLRDIDGRITYTSRLRVTSVLHEGVMVGGRERISSQSRSWPPPAQQSAHRPANGDTGCAPVWTADRTADSRPPPNAAVHPEPARSRDR